ncbi:hypothetical protein ACFL1X_08250 [Candidatus Hydrogenedentota bacterium]
MKLDGIQLDAQNGDFSFISKIVIYFLPKDGGDPVLIGWAKASDNDITSDMISLNLNANINFMQLVRSNDSSSVAGSPTLRAVTTGTPPTTDLLYNVTAELEVTGTIQYLVVGSRA